MNSVSTIVVGGKLHRPFPSFPSQLITIDQLVANDIPSFHPVFYMHTSGNDLQDLNIVLRQKLLYACLYMDNTMYPAGLPIFIFSDGRGGAEYFAAPLGWHEEAIIGWMKAFFHSPVWNEIGFERVNRKYIHAGHENLVQFILHDCIRDEVKTIRQLYPPLGFILALHKAWGRDLNVHKQAMFDYNRLFSIYSIDELVAKSRIWSMEAGEEIAASDLYRK